MNTSITNRTENGLIVENRSTSPLESMVVSEGDKVQCDRTEGKRHVSFFSALMRALSSVAS